MTFIKLRIGLKYASFCIYFVDMGSQHWKHGHLHTCNLLFENLLKLTLRHHLFYSTESFSNMIPFLTSFLVCFVFVVIMFWMDIP